MQWIEENGQRLRSLSGDTVLNAMIAEMALFEGGRSPVWRHPALPFIQAQTIELALASGRLARFETYQNDVSWGIAVDFVKATSRDRYESPLWVDATTRTPEPSIFRVATDVIFPTGVLSTVIVGIDENGDIGNVQFSVGSHPILMIAGEVYEVSQGYRIISPDESILLFLCPDDALKVPFNHDVIPPADHGSP